MATITGMNALGQAVTHTVDDTLVAQRRDAANKRALTGYIGEQANKLRNGGISVGGVPVGTDALAIGYTTGAAKAAEKDATFTAQYVVSPTQSVTLSAAQLIAIDAAVTGFIQAAFAAEASANAQLQAGTLTTRTQVHDLFAAVVKTF